MKSVRIRSYSGPYFFSFGVNNSEYGQFLRSVIQYFTTYFHARCSKSKRKKKIGNTSRIRVKQKFILTCLDKNHKNLEKAMKENHRKKKHKNTWQNTCKCSIHIYCVFQYIFFENLIFLNSVFWLVNVLWQNLRLSKIVTQKCVFL